MNQNEQNYLRDEDGRIITLCALYNAIDSDEYNAVKCLTPDVFGQSRDGVVCVYEAESVSDGHHELIARDNGSDWIVGADDDERNRETFQTIADANGDAWLDEDEIIDDELREFVHDAYERWANFDHLHEEEGL